MINMLKNPDCAPGKSTRSVTDPTKTFKVIEGIELSNDFIGMLMGREVQISYYHVIAKCSRVIMCARKEKTSKEEEWEKISEEEKEIKSHGSATELQKKIKESGRESIVEWAVDWLMREFKQQLSPLSDLENVTVATSQRSRQQ